MFQNLRSGGRNNSLGGGFKPNDATRFMMDQQSCRSFYTQQKPGMPEPSECKSVNPMRETRQKIAIHHYKEDNQKLRSVINNTKTFLNMVIHDLRNPTS
mmetsp:Transcript_11879/g.18347  ORF Transcript_11879/g.18347 Transcript_11879/m.18347 type:complete len:99 (+) Transcript_11879:954-1250(+)